MDERFAIEVLSGRRRGIGPACLRSICTAASWGYGAGVAVRNAAYDHRWKSVEKVSVPVISLGNLTTGGTGKTPLVAYLAERLQALGFRPGIVSRGYRSLDNRSNDERLVLEQLLPHVPQILNPDRVRGAQDAMTQHDCNLILLDDGFQHRRLRRDLDLVLIDAIQPWGFGQLLPRGLLREPLSALRRADAVILTRCDHASRDELAAIRSTLKRWRGTADCIEVRFLPQRLRNSDGQSRSLPETWPNPCLAFCGIGNPDGFQQSLTRLGIQGPLHVFPDHHHYTADDLRRLGEQADGVSASLILTTQKDLVKIPVAHLSGRPLWAVEIATEVVAGEEWLDRAFAKLSQPIRTAA